MTDLDALATDRPGHHPLERTRLMIDVPQEVQDAIRVLEEDDQYFDPDYWFYSEDQAFACITRWVRTLMPQPPRPFEYGDPVDVLFPTSGWLHEGGTSLGVSTPEGFPVYVDPSGAANSCGPIEIRHHVEGTE